MAMWSTIASELQTILSAAAHLIGATNRGIVSQMLTCMAQSKSFAIVGPSSWNRQPQPLRTNLFLSSFISSTRTQNPLLASEDTCPCWDGL